MKAPVLFIYLFMGWTSVDAQRFSLDRRVIVDDLLLFEDEDKPGDFYYAPDTVFIANDANGEAIINLTKYVSNKSSSDTTVQKKNQSGGVVQMRLDFSISEKRRLHAEKKLRESRPNADILGVVPITSIKESANDWWPFAYGFRDQGYYGLSCEFIPPAGELVVLQVPREEASLISNSGWNFNMALDIGYSISLKNCKAVISRDSLRTCPKTAAQLAAWLRAGILRLYDGINKPILLTEREIEPLAAYYARHLINLPAAIQVNDTSPALYFDHTDLQCANNLCSISLKEDSCLFVFNGVVNSQTIRKKEVFTSAINTGIATQQREMDFLLDGLDVDNMRKIWRYDIDLLIITGTLLDRSVFLIHSLAPQHYPVRGNLEKVAIPRNRSLDHRGNFNLEYSYFIRQRAQADKYSQPIENAQWHRSQWMANAITMPFETLNIEVEFDPEELKKKGFVGVRVAFFDAVRKDSNAYEIGQHLGDVILMVSAEIPLAQRTFLKPKRNGDYAVFYKVNKIRKSQEIGRTDLNDTVEEPVKFSTNSYFFIEF